MRIKVQLTVESGGDESETLRGVCLQRASLRLRRPSTPHVVGSVRWSKCVIALGRVPGFFNDDKRRFDAPLFSGFVAHF